jgi:hypothetical protein
MSLPPFIWFFTALILLVILQRWIHRHLHGIALLLTGRDDMALIVYSLPLLPGVMLHELSHALMAALLGVKSAHLSIIPRRQPGGRVRLGSVQVERVDAVRASLIGLAPLLFGSSVVLLISQYAFGVSQLGDAVRIGNPITVMQSLGGVLRAPDAWLWLYLLFVIANAMVPSPADRETWPPVILFSVLALLLALAAGLETTVAGIGGVIGEGLRWLAAAFTITLAVDLPFVLFIWLLELSVGRLQGRVVDYTAPIDRSTPPKRSRKH